MGMDQYELIRTAHRVYGKSIREIRRETGHHRERYCQVESSLVPELLFPLLCCGRVLWEVDFSLLLAKKRIS